MKRLLALVYGILCYCFSLGTLLYTIGFVGNVGVPKSIDSLPTSPPLEAAVIDAVLLSMFAVQHSVMARHGFKQQWTRVVSWYLERSTFVFAATMTLALVLWQWRPIPQFVWDLRGTAFASLLSLSFWAGWAFLLASTWLINHFERFGLEQVWAYFQRREFQRPPFATPAFYRWVRHPIYLGFIIACWSAPVMTAGHLLFSIATTGYILVGIHFEERDLVRAYGEAYRDYRRRVPMLLPWRRPAPAEAEREGQQAA
jgi:protein-S-isoprenylcysteine O-methyltransferase Ste14